MNNLRNLLHYGIIRLLTERGAVFYAEIKAQVRGSL